VKHVYCIVLFLFFLNSKTFGQQIIMAKDAYRHIGEKIIVKDSVYYGKVYNDSTAVVELGNRRLIAPLTVIFSAGKNPRLADPKFIAEYLQKSRISVNGLILLIKGHPTIIISDWNALKVD
jgi:hypothetical protein